MNKKKMSGNERRKYILQILKNSSTPITGGELAERTRVSRQVIVGDISLLKAKNEPIMATSRGYLYTERKNPEYEKIIACSHTPEQTEEELNLLVDYGVTVKDVTIEHPVYGDITASIMVSNRMEVKNFITQMKTTGSPLLSELTGGIHLHTISASSNRAIDQAVAAMEKAGFLIKQDH